MAIRRYCVPAALALAAAILAACAASCGGCEPQAQRRPRHIGADVLGALAPQALRDAYATPAFVVRDLADGRHVALQDTDLPPAALREISRRTRIPLSHVWGVVSFYAQFYTEPRGRHTIRCCRGTACHVKGACRVLDAVQRELGIEEGETTPDMIFYLETVACLGTCFLAPVMMIDNGYFGNLAPESISAILGSYRSKAT